MYLYFDRNSGYILYLCVWSTLIVQSFQFPPGLHDKRFNIEAVPAENVSWCVIVMAKLSCTNAGTQYEH